MADVTNHKQIEEKLHESEHRLRALVDSAMDAIVAIDEQQRIVLFNVAAEKMFGCSAKDAHGTSIDRFIPERFRMEHRARIRRFGESGVTNRGLERLKPYGVFGRTAANSQLKPLSPTQLPKGRSCLPSSIET
jgi:PAS domain-containing protein